MKNHAALLGLFCMACTSPDKLIGDSNVFADPSDIPQPEPSDPPTEASVSLSQIQSGAVSEGTLVTVEDIVATTGSSDEGFFAGTPEGGVNSGIWIQADSENKGAFDVQMGQTVTVTGIVTELVDNSPEQTGGDNTLTALVVQTAGGVVVTDEATDSMPPATELSMETLVDPSSAEQYEGTYIKLSNPSMEQVGQDMILNGSLPFVETFVSFAEQHYEILNSSIEFVKGIVGYEDGQYVLYPCSESDVSLVQPSSIELNGTNLYMTEVLAYEDPIGQCDDTFTWYLEVNYIHTSDLDVDTIYLQVTDPNGNHHAKLSTEDSINPNQVMLISNGRPDNCLSIDGYADLSMLQMAPVSGLGGAIPTIDNSSIVIKLYYAATETDYVNDTRILIDRIDLQSFQLNQTMELDPTLNGESTDTVVSNGDWCESSRALYDFYGTPIEDGVGIPINGSPGSLNFHCTGGLDTATETQQ